MGDPKITYPMHTITDDNHGGYIVLATAQLLVWSILFYFIRIAVQLATHKSIEKDDIAAAVATVIGLAQSIVLMLACSVGGLGKKIAGLDQDKLHTTELLVYSSEILYIVTLTCAKIASSELISRLAQQSRLLLACRTLSGLTLLWGIASVLTVGINCNPSKPWDMVGRCADSSKSWIAIGSINIAIELALLLLPLFLVWSLQMRGGYKAVVLFAFGIRLPLIPIIVLRLVDLDRIQHSTDYTFDVTMPMVYLAAEMHYTLISMTIPCFRPFLRLFDTGGMATDASQIDRALGASPNDQTRLTVPDEKYTRRMSSAMESSLSRSQSMSRFED